MAVFASGAVPQPGRAIRSPSFLGMLAVLCALAACSDAPDVREPLARQLPQVWQLDSFKVEAEESVGTRVEPEYHSRFRATASPREDLYLPVASLLDTAVLKVAQRKGEKAELYGIARATLLAGEWTTRFDMQRELPTPLGRPSAAYAGAQVVVGTPAFLQFMASAARRFDEAEYLLVVDEQELASRRMALVGFERESRDAIRVSHEQRDREVRMLQSERQALLKAQSRAALALMQRLNATEQQQLAVPRRERNEALVALDKAWRQTLAEWNKLRAQLDQERSRDYLALQRAQAAEDAAAVKRLDRTALIAWRAEATGKGRDARRAVDERQAPRRAELQVGQAAAAAHHRERTDEVNRTWASRNEAISKAMATERAEGQQQIQSADKEAIEGIDAAILAAGRRQQAFLVAQQAEVAERQGQVNGEANRILIARSRLAAERRVFASLERGSGHPTAAGPGVAPVDNRPRPLPDVPGVPGGARRPVI